MNMKRDETPRDIPRDTPHHQKNNNNNRCRLHRHQDEGPREQQQLQPYFAIGILTALP